jgi:hypothetical protein
VSDKEQQSASVQEQPPESVAPQCDCRDCPRCLGRSPHQRLQRHTPLQACKNAAGMDHPFHSKAGSAFTTTERLLAGKGKGVQLACTAHTVEVELRRANKHQYTHMSNSVLWSLQRMWTASAIARASLDVATKSDRKPQASGCAYKTLQLTYRCLDRPARAALYQTGAVEESTPRRNERRHKLTESHLRRGRFGAAVAGGAA